MTQPVWDEAKFGLGVAEMDATHHEFVDQVAAILQASDAEFPALFATLVEHTRQHFENEAKLMRACRFPAIGEHESEHLRVLGEINHLKVRVAMGRLGMARAYCEGLPIWFGHHLATMDAALAACLRQQRSATVPQA